MNRLKPRQFWDTQPVPKLSEQGLVGNQFEEQKSGPLQIQNLQDVKKDPYKLPEGFKWAVLDLNDGKILKEVRNSIKIPKIPSLTIPKKGPKIPFKTLRRQRHFEIQLFR